ncbi:hypothetical protein HNR42_001357 [Deinobacterium chartae]|uniref:WD40-like Beta Propeller Repeat n=1 Tax=Deinobacterium chartae TaxID=521158 RepID=A0A841HZ39_9DEIO|nr:hypothetical protein [Deinobacterium chartae]MBB6097934.1 hypothetical protein [Deinobacterium chartae]
MRGRVLAALALLGAAWAAPVALTEPGCCAFPRWSADSREVMYIDRVGNRTAYYAVNATRAGTPRRALNVADYSPDLRYAYDPAQGRLRDLGGNRRLSADLGAGPLWSAGPLIGWNVSGRSGRYDTVPTAVFVADLEAGLRAGRLSPRRLVTVYGGGAVGWLGEDTLLVSGKSAPGDELRALRAVRADGRGARVLARARNLRGVLPAPGGRWVVYYVAFDAPGRNGLYVVSGAGEAPRRLDFFGSYRWRDAHTLLYIPLETGAKSHRLMAFDARSGRSRELLDLGARVGGDGWEVSPDGKRIFYRNADDQRLYALELPAS